MKNCMITFRSVTPAQRAETLLKGAGMWVTLRRTPRRMESRGCGYCLQVEDRWLPAAMDLLRENGISWQRVYTPRENGVWEERL